MSRIYTTKTPSLKATIADIRNLDAKKMLLNGKNILDYISDSEFNSYDTRDPQLKNDELDIWNTAISLSEEGHIEVKPFEHTYLTISPTQETTIRSAVKVIDNEVLGANDKHLMYWQTDGLTNGYYIYAYNNDISEFKSDLSRLTTGHDMFVGCTNLTSFDNNLSNLTNSRYMFAWCTNLTTFSSDLPSLTDGTYMFQNCENLTSFTSDLSSLTNGNGMFFECNNLETFSSDLPSLTDGTGMFYHCKLSQFTSDLSSLTNGSLMFGQTNNLQTLKTDMPKLINGSQMFHPSTLKTFIGDLSSLEKGWEMFRRSNLESFSSNLASLTNGQSMFSGCKLDAKSVANIVHTLPTHKTGGFITIGIGCDNTAEDQLLFAQECDCETWQELLDEFSAKNWRVYFECNGRPTEAATYGMRRGETLPIYAKLEEVTDEKHAQYTSADGSKFYNINYFHSTNGSTEGYDVFSSLEEAISTYNVTPKN